MPIVYPFAPLVGTGPVLVVDDDPGIRRFITLILEEEGYQVVTAENGRDAFARIAAERPALVLLDLNMPVMTGWELHATLREHGLGIPIVYMTAGQRAREEATRHHADGALPKPFDLPDLLDVVARFVR